MGSEGANFKVRLLWCELHGMLITQDRDSDKVEKGEAIAATVKGVVTTDSKGGYDAVTMRESPTLGLSNMNESRFGRASRESKPSSNGPPLTMTSVMH